MTKGLELCLFRIAQEGLQNVIKHSGATEASVDLVCHSDALHLYIADHGVGFDIQELRKSEGLGFLSMKERLRLVGGQLSLDSRPGHGTRIDARIPLPDGRPDACE